MTNKKMKEIFIFFKNIYTFIFKQRSGESDINFDNMTNLVNKSIS